MLGFIAGEFDMTFDTDVTIPLMKDITARRPSAVCELVPTAVSRNLIVNRDAPPFDNADLRQAMALTLDRNAFNEILQEGKGDIGGAMLPPPEGSWGLPKEQLAGVPGLRRRREEPRGGTRASCRKLGYGPDKRMKLKVSTRNIADLSRSRR